MTASEVAPLLRAIEEEAAREQQQIRARASDQARRIETAAEEEAARILSGDPPAVAAPPADPRLGVRRVELLECYRDRLEELRRGVSRELSSLGGATRRRLVLAVLSEVLGGLPPGVYRLEAAPELWEAIDRAPPFPAGRVLRPASNPRVGEPDGANLTGEDGATAVTFTLESVVSRYFETESHRVARLLLGHGTP